MKKTILFLTFIGFTTLLSCNQSTTKEESVATEIVEKEEALANEAKDESKSAKEDAQATEESIDKLLEDI